MYSGTRQLKKIDKSRVVSKCFVDNGTVFFTCLGKYKHENADFYTCGWHAALILTKLNEVGSALFWNFSPIWTQNEHQKKFHQSHSDLPARQHSQTSLEWAELAILLSWYIRMALMKKNLMLILCLYRWKVSEKCTPNFVPFRKG